MHRQCLSTSRPGATVNLATPTSSPPTGRAASPVPAPAKFPPLLPVILPLIVAAIVINVVFTWVFPGIDPQRAGPDVRFTDATAEVGIDFTHRHGSEPAPTTLGGGVSVLDFNRDESPDLFFVNGAPWPWSDSPWQSPATSKLYRNDGTGHFTDVTSRAGLDFVMNAMAAVAGDYDNDGFDDLFVTCIGGNRLFHNRGNGTFVEVTAEAGVGGEPNDWSTGATWLDFNHDGRLDLIVTHYLRWPAEFGLAAAINFARVGRSYGTPVGYLGLFPTVYQNLGDGRFTPLRDHAGLRPTDPLTGFPREKTLAVTPVDANQDGRLDLLFSFHTGENDLFLNTPDGRFAPWVSPDRVRREGIAAGIAAAGSLPLAPVNDTDDTFPLLRAFGSQAPISTPPNVVNLAEKLGWIPLDYDLDGHRELLVTGGTIEPDFARIESDAPQLTAPELRWNDGTTWHRSAPSAETPAIPALAGRGTATADFDGDGDLDVVIAQNQAPAIFLRNDQRAHQPWLRLSLSATRSHHSAGGARVEVHTPRHVIVRTLAPALSYLGQSEAVLTFGLGEDTRIRRIVIRWPSGQRQEIRGITINQSLHITEPD